MTTARKIANAWTNRVLPDIFYEEPEGIENGMQQELPIEHIKRLLTARYQARKGVFVSNAVFVSYDVTNGNASVQPDLFIAFGVDEAAIRENLPYFWTWETGKAPDFVMAVASPSTSANDLGRKRDLYAGLGVAEYWRFDPTGGDLYGRPLAGDRLVNGAYEPCEIHVGPDGSERSHSALLSVDFHWNGKEFDVLDPATEKTIDPMTTALEALHTAGVERDAAREKAAEAARLRERLRRLKWKWHRRSNSPHQLPRDIRLTFVLV